MTNRQVVSRLRELGYQVDIYVRKDGSIRVTSINGEKFSSRLSVGVNRAREILFSQADYVPPHEAEQRAQVLKQRELARISRASGNTLKSQSETFKASYKKIRNLIRKLNRKLEKEGKKASYRTSWQEIKRLAIKQGKEPQSIVRQSLDYFTSIYSYIAPRVMVQTGIDKIKGYSLQLTLADLLQFLEAHLNKDDIDIYEMKITIDYIYNVRKGLVSDDRVAETQKERIAKLEATLHR